MSSFGFEFDGRVLVPVQVGEAEPIDVILDSGLGSRLLMLTHLETGQELELSFARTVPGARGAGSGENKDIHLTKGNPLSLPGLELGTLPVAVMDESRAESSFHNLGVLGAALFISYTVKIDFETQIITVYDPDSFLAPTDWEALPLDFGNNLPILETSLSVEGETQVPVRLILDTGGKPALALALDEDAGIRRPSQTLWSLSGTGLRGDVFADLGRVSRVQIGNSSLRELVAGFWTGEEAPILAEINANGVLGMGALYRFNLIFDYARRRLLVKPNRFFGDPFERNMAGMVLEKTPKGESVVYWIDEGSEAEVRGIRKGDVLEKVNGKPAVSYSFLELKRIFEADGATVNVTVRREGQSRTVTLTLRRTV